MSSLALGTVKAHHMYYTNMSVFSFCLWLDFFFLFLFWLISFFNIYICPNSHPSFASLNWAVELSAESSSNTGTVVKDKTTMCKKDVVWSLHPLLYLLVVKI